MASNPEPTLEMSALERPSEDQPLLEATTQSSSARSSLIRRTLKVENITDLDPLIPLSQFLVRRAGAGSSSWAFSDQKGNPLFACTETPMSPQDGIQVLPVLKFVSESGATFLMTHQGQVDWLVVAGAEPVQGAVVGKIGKKSIRLSRGVNETWAIYRTGQTKSSSCGLTTCCRTSSSVRYGISFATIGSDTTRGSLGIGSEGVGSVTIPAELGVEHKALIVVGVVMALNLPYEIED